MVTKKNYNVVTVPSNSFCLGDFLPCDIYYVHPLYPMNWNADDYIVLATSAAEITNQVLTKITKEKNVFILAEDKEKLDKYCARSVSLKDIKASIEKVEDVTCHLFEMAGNKEFIMPEQVSEFRSVASSIVSVFGKSSSCLGSLKNLTDHSEYTYYHSVGVALVAQAIAWQMGIRDTEKLTDYAIGGLLHDIGKLDIPLNIIEKPGPLNDEEWKIIKQHPQMGVKRLKHAGLSENILKMVEFHHEKFNGKGYPNGLSGTAIPVEARILMLADIYNAITTKRSYHDELKPFESLTIMREKMWDDIWQEGFMALVKVLNAKVGTNVKVDTDEKENPTPIKGAA